MEKNPCTLGIFHLFWIGPCSRSTAHHSGLQGRNLLTNWEFTLVFRELFNLLERANSLKVHLHVNALITKMFYFPHSMRKPCLTLLRTLVNKTFPRMNLEMSDLVLQWVPFWIVCNTLTLFFPPDWVTCAIGAGLKMSWNLCLPCQYWRD